MEYISKTVLLHGGEVLVLRAPCEDDAAVMQDYLRRTAEETDFLLRSPGEEPSDIETEVRFLRQSLDSPFRMMIVAQVDGVFAGSCMIEYGNKRKTAHRASVGIALLKQFWGRGIGTVMFRELIAAAQAHGIAQIELDYVEGNERARTLYEKMGFVSCSVLPNAIHLDNGTLLNEIKMIKYLK